MQQWYQCPNCGTPVAFGVRFCGNCGTPFVWQENIPPQSPYQQQYGYAGAEPDKKATSPLFIVLVSIMIVGILGVGSFFAFTLLSQNTSDITQPSGDTTPAATPETGEEDKEGMNEPEDPVMQFMLEPSDLGQGWVYEFKLGSETYGGWTPQSMYPGKISGKALSQAIYQLIDIDDNTKLIKGVFQNVRIYPDVGSSIEDDFLKEARTYMESLDSPFWDELYLYTTGDSMYRIIASKKDNQIIQLKYREEIRRIIPLSGLFDDYEYQELNQEQAQSAGDFLSDLAEIIQEKIATQ